ncbi:MAG: hypothetical protein ACUZ77_10465 [Candidatus Brocadiales bacterium]
MSRSNDDQAREYVRGKLETLGFQPDVVPEAAYPTPDLSLPLSAGRVLIEVKSRDYDDQLRHIVVSPPGTTHRYTNSAIETKLRDGLYQIRKFPAKSPNDFSVIWLLACKSGITDLTRPAAMTLLYGVQNIDGVMANTKKYYEKDCFFFGYSFFHRRDDLDGVVLQDYRETTLCVNPHSKRYPKFAQTDFVRVFKAQFSVLDPAEQETAGECFLADCNYPRKDVNSVVGYLKKKYGLETVEITQFVLVNHPVDSEG